MPAPKRMSLRAQETQAKAQCYDWNKKYPAGVCVSYQELLGRGETHRAKTTGAAFVMCCQAVIFVEGLSGAVSLEHCTAVGSET